ncbi:MAG: serine/threonine protein kinase, partial [Deltaproteobacteria bacterium]|nr:serine/threonine protein kinase [Deltaproteobacteria bacterium]
MSLSGFITLNEKLGEGGMGSVWAAHHAGLGTKVAVKLISRELTDRHPTLLPRFQREALVTTRIMSPHAVQNLEYGCTKEGAPYIVMELLEGESLEDRLKRQGRLTLDETEIIVSQIAQVLTEAHELGITHRDIKP